MSITSFIMHCLTMQSIVKKDLKRQFQMKETFNRAMQAARDNNIELFNFYYGAHIKLFNDYHEHYN